MWRALTGVLNRHDTLTLGVHIGMRLMMVV